MQAHPSMIEDTAILVVGHDPHSGIRTDFTDGMGIEIGHIRPFLVVVSDGTVPVVEASRTMAAVRSSKLIKL